MSIYTVYTIVHACGQAAALMCGHGCNAFCNVAHVAIPRAKSPAN